MSQSPPPPPPPPGSGQGDGQYGGYPPPPPGGYSAPPPYGSVPQGNNGKALWALILGIVGLVCCGIFTGIPAIILGKMAQNEIDASGGAQGGRGLATAGFVLGIIAVVWGVIWGALVLTGTIDLGGSFSTSP